MGLYTLVRDPLLQHFGAISPRYNRALNSVAYAPVELTPEQRAASDALLERYNQEQRAGISMRESAAARARVLLLSCLRHDQRVMLEQSGKFRVVSNLGDIFEIVQGRQHNIFKLDVHGVRREEWCIHIRDHTVPDSDNMLAQKLCIETDVEDLYRQANVWSLPNRLMIHQAGYGGPARTVVAPNNPYGVAV
jgi:hypothetical protein